MIMPKKILMISKMDKQPVCNGIVTFFCVSLSRIHSIILMMGMRVPALNYYRGIPF